MGYTFDGLYFNKENIFDNDGHVIHFGWKIYNNNNGTKGFCIKKKKKKKNRYWCLFILVYPIGVRTFNTNYYYYS